MVSAGPLVPGVLADGVVARVVYHAQLAHRLTADRSLFKQMELCMFDQQMATCATCLDGPVVGGALCVPLESLDVDDLGGEALEDDADVLDRQVRRLLHRHLQIR